MMKLTNKHAIRKKHKITITLKNLLILTKFIVIIVKLNKQMMMKLTNKQTIKKKHKITKIITLKKLQIQYVIDIYANIILTRLEKMINFSIIKVK